MKTKKLKTPRNKFEFKIYDQLRRSGCTFKYEGERLAYVKAGHYTPDFIISTPNGKIYVEAKGYFRPEHKSKMVAVKKCHPELDIRLLFYANPWTKTGVQYSKWAIKNGFKYAFQTIPEAWLDGY